MLLLVEGNIGVGKSTFLRTIKELDPSANVIPEPLDVWEQIGILDAFYSDPARWAYTFQSVAFATRVSAVINHRTPDALNVVERSVYIDKHGFAKHNREIGNISDIEWKAYSCWYNLMISKFENDLQPDKVVYLRASPERCFERIKKRSRSAESSISLDYLKGLHEKYEKWVARPEVKDRVVVVDLESDYESESQYKQFVSELLSRVTE
jgi:deoxycitidine kinase